MISPHAPLATRFLGQLPHVPPSSGATEPSEATLVAAARTGDAAAYGCLVRKYQDRLCSSLQHICGSFADAQDAAQEAFLRAYLRLSSFHETSGFYTWLYRIAMNVAVSEHRRQRSRCSSAERLARQTPPAQLVAERSDERLLRSERVSLVRQALDKLSAEHRAILILREMEDCDYDEIAYVLSIPVGTVRSRLHRARLQLRDTLLALEGSAADN